MDEIEGAERERDGAGDRGRKQVGGNSGDGDDNPGEENPGGGGDDEDDEEETENTKTKRRRVNSSSFHWNQGANLILSATLTAAHERVRRQVEDYSLDLKNALQSLDVAIAKPSLPKGQWKNVLLDGYVDFDDLLGNLFTTELEETSLYLSGETTLEFRRPKPVTKVNTHGQWINAFRIYEEAVNFAFPGRQSELQAYWSHIHFLFAAMQPVLHHRVINYDRAVRIFVGSRRDILLNEVEKFAHLKVAHIDSGGVAVGSSSNFSGKTSKSKRKHPSEICRNWNFRSCNPNTCVFRHACIFCQSTEHVGPKCPSRNQKSS
ncbi:hypothetical protein EV361DRAFT_813456 [Lentinula raphanica]|uniref:C3H1-type domain-containing protein n=1 Tax=Lentinula raphanica TaxID=153919 RepID=A0AA38NUY5_9AGAR|nr:hypothetical protein F5878DRAFT_549891 [Lentinula raphanica]KAJ3963351.1 hypothetical protein EV361DRAFT_813456 [Lentinula raphanica]